MVPPAPLCAVGAAALVVKLAYSPGVLLGRNFNHPVPLLVNHDLPRSHLRCVSAPGQIAACYPTWPGTPPAELSKRVFVQVKKNSEKPEAIKKTPKEKKRLKNIRFWKLLCNPRFQNLMFSQTTFGSAVLKTETQFSGTNFLVQIFCHKAVSQFLSVPESELYCDPIDETKILCKRLANGCQTPANAGKRQAINGRYTRFCVEGFLHHLNAIMRDCGPRARRSA